MNAFKVGQAVLFVLALHSDYEKFVGQKVVIQAIGAIEAYDYSARRSSIVNCVVKFSDGSTAGAFFFQLEPPFEGPMADEIDEPLFLERMAQA
jgi:hypothetical protein